MFLIRALCLCRNLDVFLLVVCCLSDCLSLSYARSFCLSVSALNFLSVCLTLVCRNMAAAQVSFAPLTQVQCEMSNHVKVMLSLMIIIKITTYLFSDFVCQVGSVQHDIRHCIHSKLHLMWVKNASLPLHRILTRSFLCHKSLPTPRVPRWRFSMHNIYIPSRTQPLRIPTLTHTHT